MWKASGRIFGFERRNVITYRLIDLLSYQKFQREKNRCKKKRRERQIEL